MNRALLLLVGACVLPLAGCATFGTNVKGNFACSAPDGICAPSSVIDDRALALIAGERIDAVPAVPAVAPALLRSRGVPAGQVAQPAQKTLRIVFPAHVDGQGRYHETAVVRAVVDQGTWLAASDLPAQPPAMLADLAAPIAIAAAAPAAASAVASSASPPTAEAVRAARAQAAALPVSREGVAAEVEAALAKPTTNAPTRFPAKVEDRSWRPVPA